MSRDSVCVLEADVGRLPDVDGSYCVIFSVLCFGLGDLTYMVKDRRVGGFKDVHRECRVVFSILC